VILVGSRDDEARVVRVRQLGGSVDEPAPAEPGARYPVAHLAEDGQEALLGRFVGCAGDGGEPFAQFLVGGAQVGLDEVVLGAEVLVEGGLGDRSLGDDGIDADRPDAALVEEAGSGLEDALAGRGGRVGNARSVLQTCLYWQIRDPGRDAE